MTVEEKNKDRAKKINVLTDAAMEWLKKHRKPWQVVGETPAKTPLKPLGKAKWQLPTEGRFHRYLLEGENLERFRKLYPKHSNARLMKWFGISDSTLQRLRRELGLSKDMAAVRHGLKIVEGDKEE